MREILDPMPGLVWLTDSERDGGLLDADRLASALRTFREAGLLALGNAFEETFIEAVRRDHDRALDHHLDAKGGLEALAGKTFGVKHVGFFPPLLGLPAHATLLAHPIACQLMDALLGPDFRCSFVHTNTACPGSGYQPIHRDTGPLFGRDATVPHPVASLVVNVPLCDFHVGNGSTEVWPGTHLVPDGPDDDPGNIGARADAFPSIRTNLPVGALVLRDLRVWHRGMPNDSDRHRTMMAIVYQRSWMDERRISIPETTWNAWTDKARQIFRHNSVVADAEHRPRTWDD